MPGLRSSVHLVALFFILSLSVNISCSPGEIDDKPVLNAPASSPAPASKDERRSDLRGLLESLPNPADAPLTEERAVELAKLSLGCVDREYPNKPGHVANGDDTIKPPRELHPAFFGCFDWHSAVHGHWAMVRILKKYPEISVAKEIRATLGSHLTAEKIAVELEYFKQEHHNLFERPYGWGWLLRLAAELATLDDPDAKRWLDALSPLAAHISGLTKSYLETLSVPVREGTHQSTAFALTHILDWAKVANDKELAETIERRSRDFFDGDIRCPTNYEPSGEDFISPCLVEADLMRRVLPKDEFAGWLDKFLPELDSTEFVPLLKPIEVKDKKDPKIGHLIGLFFQRAAAYRGIAQSLDNMNPKREIFSRLSSIHREGAQREMVDSGYGGEHWLASFAIYLLTDAGPY